MRVLVCLLVVLAFGCNDSELLVTPHDNGATSLAKHHEAMMVPIKGDATFTPDLTLVPPVLDCGHGEVFFRRFTGEGVFSHLGATTFVGVSDDCWVNPDFTLGVTGRSTLTAANGDELWGVWGLKTPGPPPGGTVSNWEFYPYAGDYPVEFTGGTGRFDDASGYTAGAGTFDYGTMTATYWMDGMISSVGSLK